MADDCTPEQCASMLPDLQSCVDFARFGGGDNWIALCSHGHRNFAVRFSVVQDLAMVHKSPNMYVFPSLNFGRALCRSQSPIVLKLRPAIQGTWRRVLSMSEYYGEIRWRDEHSWAKMVFPPAFPLYECLACVQLCSSVPLRDESGHPVANLSRKVRIGISMMKGVDGSLNQLKDRLTILHLCTILVGYHLDLASMADIHHFHDAHAGNILISLSSKLPAVRWHDFAGNFGSAARRVVAQTFTDGFARQIEDFSGTVISQIRETHQGFASRLNETCKTCSMVGRDMIWVRQCLRQRAFDLASTMLSLSALQTLEKQRLLESIAPALSDSDARVLWRHWSEGTREYGS